jgi:polysaccharide pyruvyl transferase WcaK-like protein
LMKGAYSILNDDLMPQEMLTFLAQFDLVISMRLHGVIMGLTVGIPVMALTYKEEPKIKNLMWRMNLQDNIFYVNRLDKQKLLNKIKHILSKKKEIQEKVFRSVDTLKDEFNKGNELFIESLMY